MALMYDWKIWARPNQLPTKDDYQTWLILAGRGFGKTRIGAETVRAWVHQLSTGRMALVGKTPADVRDTMIEGESGILSISPPWDKPQYIAGRRRVEWNNGAFALIYSGAEPEAIRGKQHEKAWIDELFTFKYPQLAWDNLSLGMRLGRRPQVVITTTPKPIKVLKDIMKDTFTLITRGNTYENRDNLPDFFYRTIVSRYEGTRLGRQELYAEVLDDNPNALWKRADLDKFRVSRAPELSAIVVGVDPEATSNEESNETGIITVGKSEDGHFYVLHDNTILGTPNEWGLAVVSAYHRSQANLIIAETNQGGEMVEYVIKTIDGTVPYRGVRATRGKYVRAEPISALYEQGKVHHVGFFPELEDQLCEWEPGSKSPDRLDALVWAISHLNPKTVFDIY